MARTESLGPGNTWSTPSRPVYGPGGTIPRYKASQDERYEIPSIEQLIAETQSKQKALEKNRKFAEAAALQPLINNYDHIRLSVPRKYEKKVEETTLNDIANLLLDLTGYGAAIANFIPIPQVRIGGMLAGYASGAIRAGINGRPESASRQLNSAVRAYNNYLGRTQRYSKRY